MKRNVRLIIGSKEETSCSETDCTLTINLRTQFGLTRQRISEAFDQCGRVYGYQRLPYLEYHDPLFVPSD